MVSGRQEKNDPDFTGHGGLAENRNGKRGTEQQGTT